MSIQTDFNIDEFNAYMLELLKFDQDSKFDKILGSSSVLSYIRFFDFRHLTQDRHAMLMDALKQLEMLQYNIDQTFQKFNPKSYTGGTYIDVINGDNEHNISYNLIKYITSLIKLIKIISYCTESGNQYTFFNSIVFNTNDEESNFYNIYKVKKLYEISVKTIFPIFKLILTPEFLFISFIIFFIMFNT